MQLPFFALITLAGGLPYTNNFRNSNQSPGLFYLNRSNAAHPGRCESGWTYYDETDACYKVLNKLITPQSFFNKPFQAAESLCISFGGHLTSIHSYRENLFVADMAKMGFNMPNFEWSTWIGLVRSDYLNNNWTANWMWTDGTELDFIDWAPNEPSNPKEERCVGLASDPVAIAGYILWYQKWFDIVCTVNMRSFVCKKAASHDEL